MNRRHSYHPGGPLNKEKAMSTEPGQVRARSSSPEAERMRQSWLGGVASTPLDRGRYSNAS